MKTDKTLNQRHLGEIISREDGERYFGKIFMDIFKGNLELVAVSFTVQDEDGVQMDYTLKHKDFKEMKELTDKAKSIIEKRKRR